MNQRTSKLLRKYATISGLPYRPMKRAWNRTERNKRHRERLDVEDSIQANLAANAT